MMLTIEKQVASFELSKKLREFGFPQDTYWMWSHRDDLWTMDKKVGELYFVKKAKSYSAPTVAELMEFLGYKYSFDIWKRVDNHLWQVKWFFDYYTEQEEIYKKEASAETLADALAKMAIKVLEERKATK